MKLVHDRISFCMNHPNEFGICADMSDDVLWHSLTELEDALNNLVGINQEIADIIEDSL